MKRIFILLIVSVITGSSLLAQETTAIVKKQFMQITTVESVVGGGLGRSKMIITNPDGSQKEMDLENLFSLVGINFKNIRQNEEKIISTLKSYYDAGWKMEHVSPLTLSPESSGGMGIFMTRYLLSKSES